MERHARFLEQECYEKYGRTGKSFYYSQVASTVRWLSTASSTELTSRLSITDDPCSVSEKNTRLPALASPAMDLSKSEISNEVFHSSSVLETSTFNLSKQSASPAPLLPPIPSFAEFVNGRMENASQSNRDEKYPVKRIRLV